MEDAPVADEELGKLFGFPGEGNPVGDVCRDDSVDPRILHRGVQPGAGDVLASQ